MPRYEFKDDKSSKFWDITLSGDEVTTNWGRIGTDGQSKTKSFADDAVAKKEYEKQIKSKTKKGYALAVGSGAVAAPPAAARAASAANPELEAAIRANPDDKSVYQVYGDWLQGEGDALGELISLQCAREDDSKLAGNIEKLFNEHTERFFGPVHEAAEERSQKLSLKEQSGYRQRNGWPTHSWSYGFSNTVWRYGFIHKLEYDTGYYDRQSDQGSEAAAEDLVRMLALPSARFVREIDLGELWADYDRSEGPEMGEAVKAIVAAPCAATLRRLDFNGGDHDLNGVSLEATGLRRACPNLEELSLYAGQLTVGNLDFPKMKRFAAQTGGLDSGDMKSICDHKMPLIENLEIWFGSDEYGANCSIEDVQPLLEKKMPNLKRLGLMNAEFGDDICKAVLASPLLPQLEKLDLSMGIITHEGAEALIEAKSKLEHLERLSIRGYFSDAVTAQLKELAKEREIEVEGDEEDDYRYVEVGE